MGHVGSRNTLGSLEEIRGRFDEAILHFIIAAKLGHEGSLERLKKLYRHGLVSKDDLADTLRAYQDALNEMKSAQREEADEAQRSRLRLRDLMGRNPFVL